MTARSTTAPIVALMIAAAIPTPRWMFNLGSSQPPMKAPAIPTMMSPMMPRPVPRTIWLASQPATRPTTRMMMRLSPDIAWGSRFCARGDGPPHGANRISDAVRAERGSPLARRDRPAARSKLSRIAHYRNRLARLDIRRHWSILLIHVRSGRPSCKPSGFASVPPLRWIPDLDPGRPPRPGSLFNRVGARRRQGERP